MATKEEMMQLVAQLNSYRDAYYNNNQSIVSDAEYDDLFDKLSCMEQELGIVLSNSPTVNVGYEVQSELAKIQHSHPMKSLGKTKKAIDIVNFAKGKPVIAMSKLDGLTCSLSYNKEGELYRAETRGDGETGEDVTLNAHQISNIPLKINNNGIPLTIDGEVIVDLETFTHINEQLETPYSHPRNLAAGSIRQLDTKITKERNLSFIAWRVIEGIDKNDFNASLEKAAQLGFTITPYEIDDILTKDSITNTIKKVQAKSKELNYPIDGIVFSYVDMGYGNTLESTAHHPLHSIAYKFDNAGYETILRDIEWATSRTGQVNPVAVFDAVDLDGAMTTRATLHNVSIIKELELGIGDTILVARMNEVIPKVEDNLTKSNSYKFPTTCPCCGETLELRKDGVAEVLYCNNPNCASKLLANFTHFVSKECANIKGLSESTLEKLIGEGLIHTYKDIYKLSEHRDKLIALEGFREKSADKLLKAIEKSRDIKLENYITALGIPGIGKVAARNLSKWADNNYDTLMERLYNSIKLTDIEDFGEVMEDSIYEWYNGPQTLEKDLNYEFRFIKEVPPVQTSSEANFIQGKTFVITGALAQPRKTYEGMIISLGGKLSSSVSAKTDFLITNDAESGSSKAIKAKELGIPILSEEEFLAKVKN